MVLPFPNCVHILSEGIHLSDSHLKTLSLGVDFIPHRSLDYGLVHSLLDSVEREFMERFVNSLGWKYHFRHNDSAVPPFYVNTHRQPPPSQALMPYVLSVADDLLRLLESRDLVRDRGRHDRLRVNDLQRLLVEENLIIKEADKNLGITILSMSDYEREVRKQLSDGRYYREEPCNLLMLAQRAERLLENVLSIDSDPHSLTGQIVNFVRGHKGFSEPRLPLFYVNPKIHKSPWTGRPIVASTQWITTPFSIVVSHFLSLLVKRYAVGYSVITHSFDLIDILRSMEGALLSENSEGELRRSLFLQTGDISSMYTNLKNNKCLMAVNWAIARDAGSGDPVLEPSVRLFLADFLKFVLENNFFYEPTLGKQFKQHSGIAMGSNCSAELANLTCYFVEFAQFDALSLSRPIFVRYLDDVFVAREYSEGGRDRNFEGLDYGPELPIVWSAPSKEVDYLDLKIRFGDDCKFEIRTHQKVLNSYQYPHFRSNLPLSTKRGFIKGELIRYVRISSKRSDFEWMKALFRARLVHRGYPNRFIDRIYSEVPWAEKPSFEVFKRKEDDGPPLIFRVPFDDRLQLYRPIGSSLRSKWGLIADKNFCENLHPRPPMICHTVQPKLRSQLIRADHKKLREKIVERMEGSIP